MRQFSSLTYFNPRSPWGERLVQCVQLVSWMSFQSTLPVGGATGVDVVIQARESISIHAPRGGSDVNVKWHELTNIISIHAPRGGSDSGG